MFVRIFAVSVLRRIR